MGYRGILLLAACLCAGAASAATINVPAGQSTIQAAINAANTGDTVLVAPGTYHEFLNFNGKAITVKSSGGAAVTFLEGNSNQTAVITFNAGETKASVLQGFSITNTSTGSFGSAIFIGAASPSVLDNVFVGNEVSGSDAVIFVDSASPTILRNYFSSNACSASLASVILIANASKPVIADNVIANNPCAAILFTPNSQGFVPQVYNNTFVGNTAGVLIFPDTLTPTVSFSNNILAFNQYGVEATPNGAGPSTWSHNLVYGNTTADYSGVASQTGLNGNISVDPQLTDWQTGDVHLPITSPAVDVGDNTITQASSTDFYGDPRLFASVSGNAAVVDIGAVEYFVIPVVTAVSGSILAQADRTTSGALTSAGSYPGESLTFAIVNQPADGNVTITDAATGAYQYVPTQGYSGPDSFTFDVTDQYGTVSNAATEQVTVAFEPPVANDGSVSAVENFSATGRVSASTAFAGQTLLFYIVSNPSHGLVSLASTNGWFSYTPAQGYLGPDSFTFQAADQYGTLSNVATVQVTVTTTVFINVPADQPTIQAAINAATTGETVLVAPGTYHEQLDFLGKAITVKSSGGAAVTILDGNDSAPIVNFQSGEGNQAILQGFTLTDADSFTGNGGAVNILSCSPTIEDDVFVNNFDSDSVGGAISANNSSAIVIRNTFTANSDSGGYVVDFQGGSPVVADNVFVNNTAAAIVASVGTGAAPQLYNNTIVGNHVGMFIDFFGAQPAAFISNNLIAFNGVGIEPFSDVALPTISSNLVYGNTTKDYFIANQTGIHGNISVDPKLKDRADGDVHLLYGSPAIDAGDGTVSQISSTDVFGAARVYAGLPGHAAAVDIGAIEFEPPVVSASDGSALASLDTTATGLLGSSGANGEPLSFALVAPAGHGTVTITDATKGAFQYVPAQGYIGPDSFTFNLTDAYGTVSNTATEQVSVQDATPTGNGGNVTTAPDTEVDGTLSAVALAGQTLTYTIISDAQHGEVTLEGSTGKFTYTPATGYAGTDSFTFDVVDQYSSTSNIATEQVTVSDIAPVANAGSTSTVADGSATGTLSVTSGYVGQNLGFAVVTGPAHGNVSVDPGTGQFTYTPAQGYVGADSFTFQVADQYQTKSGIAIEQITVSDVAPTANDGSFDSAPDVTSSLGLSAASSYAGQTLTYSIVSGPSHGVAHVVAATGAFTYTPTNGYIGSDSFTFKVTDGAGTASNVATESVSIADVAATANSGALSTNAGQAANGALSATGAYAGQTLTYSLVGTPAHGTAAITDASTGAYTYTPGTGFAGSDSFTFKVTDGAGTPSNTATVSVTVNDEAATADNGNVTTTPDSAVDGTILAGNAYPDQTFTYSIVSQPTHGNLTLNNDMTGSFTYTPATGYSGSDSFTFKAVDAYGTPSNTATEHVTIGDSAPAATGGGVSTMVGVAVGGTLSATPAYSGQTLSLAIVTNPSHGQVSLDPSTGQFTYTPAQSYAGADAFTFKAIDQYGLASAIATEQLTIADIAPTVSDGSMNAAPDNPVSGMLLATQGYTGQTLTFSLVSQPAHGAVTLAARTGKFTYTPATGYAGSDSFTFQVKDAFGTLSNVATESVTVDDIAPKAQAGSGFSMGGRAVRGQVRADIAYRGQVLQYSLLQPPAHGSVKLTAAGAYVYTPARGYRGRDSFTYQAIDQWGTASNTAAVSIIVR